MVPGSVKHCPAEARDEAVGDHLRRLVRPRACADPRVQELVRASSLAEAGRDLNQHLRQSVDAPLVDRPHLAQVEEEHQGPARLPLKPLERARDRVRLRARASDAHHRPVAEHDVHDAALVPEAEGLQRRAAADEVDVAVRAGLQVKLGDQAAAVIARSPSSLHQELAALELVPYGAAALQGSVVFDVQLSAVFLQEAPAPLSAGQLHEEAMHAIARCAGHSHHGLGVVAVNRDDG
mmetsp:Transcript_70402/g.181435  ORF Transcript_70402/g.181435 Transcript_70402/m.181435 type:complete len:236 (+) Transcript_70402:710-1417(+)